MNTNELISILSWENSTEANSANNLKHQTLKRYAIMFQKMYRDKNSIFINYILSQPVNENCSLDMDPILLLSRSNYSQKQAIEAALRDRVSVIEGPPGAGKTTTILSIIANLLVRGKRIAVISKNNSAIDNIKEKLDELNLPPFYLRLGNKTVMTALAGIMKPFVKDTIEQMDRLPGSQREDDILPVLYGELNVISIIFYLGKSFFHLLYHMRVCPLTREDCPGKGIHLVLKGEFGVIPRDDMVYFILRQKTKWRVLTFEK